MFEIKKGLASLAIAGTLMGTSAVGVAAERPTQNSQNGAAGVVAAVVSVLNNANVSDDNVDVTLVDINNSLNNLTALNNVLNNSPILSSNEILEEGIVVQDIDVAIANGSLNNIQLDVLRDAEVLNDANIVLSDVVGVAVLDGGDLIVFTR